MLQRGRVRVREGRVKSGSKCLFRTRQSVKRRRRPTLWSMITSAHHPFSAKPESNVAQWLSQYFIYLSIDVKNRKHILSDSNKFKSKGQFLPFLCFLTNVLL